jgi:D-arabinose 1-dehydrogenase-like Zn-dependent alcohol dehydrogenase
MGRRFDGGYAQLTCVPATNVIPFRSELPWQTIGAVPEMLQTAYGCLDVASAPTRRRCWCGGTSSVGLAAALLAKQRGMTVLSTTRNPDHAEVLRNVGVDHVLIDNGEIADKVRDILPAGVHSAIELVGTPTLRDKLAATARHRVLRQHALQPVGDQRFYPMAYIPKGMRLTSYSGEANDLPGRAPTVSGRRRSGQGHRPGMTGVHPERHPGGAHRHGSRHSPRQDRHHAIVVLDRSADEVRPIQMVTRAAG